MSEIRREAMQGVAVITPLFVLMHVLGSSPSGSLGLPALLLADLCGWILAPICGVSLLIFCLLALKDHELRELPAYCAMGLLSALMLQAMFAAWV